MTTDLVMIKAYNLKKPTKGLVFHSDRGFQYPSKHGDVGARRNIDKILNHTDSEYLTCNDISNNLTLGVDTHLDNHVAVLVNNIGQVVDTNEFTVNSIGYSQLYKW